MHAANREPNSAARKIKHVAAHCEVFGEQNHIEYVVRSGIDGVFDKLSVTTYAKRVKSGRRIGVQESLPQGEVVCDAFQTLRKVSLVVANASFPLPSLQLVPGIGKLAQITL